MTDKNNPSFEQALAELEQIVRKMESGQVSLEDAINDYTKGTGLYEQCQKKLSDARLKVEKIVKKQDGTLATEQIDSNAL